MKDDIRIWLSFIHKYNGTTVILDRFWSCNDHLQLFSDSAGGKEKGFGVYFNGKWASILSCGSLIAMFIVSNSIPRKTNTSVGSTVFSSAKRQHS
jgi:hypothetical protein